MDFGVGFLSDNVMLPILDFCYGIVPSYGLAIVALTLVIRLALYPVSAGQIRNMRRMRVAQPVMQKRQQEIRERHKNDPAKLQEEQAKIIQEFGNPLSGCLPLLIQMPILFALFATLRGSPFADIKYNINLQIQPSEQIEQVQRVPFSTKPQNIYVADGLHYSITSTLPKGNKLAVGETVSLSLQTPSGKSFSELLAEHPDSEIQPKWRVIKGAERVQLENGQLKALQPGDVSVEGVIPGIASQKGFLFIQALGRVGAIDGQLIEQTDQGPKLNLEGIHWDILLMVMGFGVSMYINQLLTGQGASSSDNPASAQQQAVNQSLPVIFSGMFLFFPLPSGVLLYMLIGNIFQTLQSAIIAREPLPENLQRIVDEENRKAKMKTVTKDNEIFALETGAAPPKPKSAQPTPKPSGFQGGNSTKVRPTESGNLLDSLKDRFQERITELQSELGSQKEANAADQIVDVKAEEVKSSPPGAKQPVVPPPSPTAPKKANMPEASAKNKSTVDPKITKKRRKNRSK
jgi:YidC/Oxa1 family membrane protein insertase